MKSYCVILASGTGSRFGADCPKQFVRISGKMIIEHTLSACDCGVFDEIVLVVSAPYVDEMKDVIAANGCSIPVQVVAGGASRKESCEKGVDAICDEEALVVIHNGVQPFVTKRELSDCLMALERHPAVTNGSPCVYTILETDGKGVLQNMPLRARCFNDLGPECFRLSLIRKILNISRNDTQFTNFTGAVMKYGLGHVFVSEGDPINIKITYPVDIIYAERILNRHG